MTRSTAGFVQQTSPWIELIFEFWPFPLLFKFSCRLSEWEKQGDSEISEHWLYWESSVRVRRKPLVKSRIAMLWSKSIPKNTMNAHLRETKFSTDIWDLLTGKWKAKMKSNGDLRKMVNIETLKVHWGNVGNRGEEKVWNANFDPPVKYNFQFHHLQLLPCPY